MHYLILAIHLYITYVIPVLALAAVLYFATLKWQDHRTYIKAANMLADMLDMPVAEAKKLMFHCPR